MTDTAQPEPPIKPLGWSEGGRLVFLCGRGENRRSVWIDEAEARTLHQELERLLDERD